MERLLRLLLVGIATVIWLVNTPEELWVVPLLVMLWGFMLISFAPSLRSVIVMPLRWLRDRPILYWLALLVYIVIITVLWLVPYQPTNGRPLTGAEYIYLLAGMWGLVFLVAFNVDSDQLRSMGSKLGNSRLSGVMVTLTTLLVLFLIAEAWLRIFYITTDGYGFTAMNYHWYKNFYWGHYNSVGYRDYEPRDDGDLTRIAVLGDSFAMGHGINNIDETFPQLLESQLGTDYDVNVIAQSGWDSDVELHYLQEYPLKPDVVILSYYLNDIDHLLTDPSQNPDAVFDFPENPALNWFVLNFFVPNFAYYNLLQFTSPVRATNFTSRLIDAHMDDDLWAQQAWWLNEIVEWTRSNEVELVVLLWPQIAAVEDSVPATVQVRDFFLERDVPVVDMTEVLIDKDPRRMIVNRFDAHPGIEAQHLAADWLYATVMDLETEGS